MPRTPDIRWADPALDYLNDTLEATLDDIDEINALLRAVRDNPDDPELRNLVDKDSVPALRDVEGDVFLATDEENWEVYILWLPTLIIVVHVERLDED